MAGGTIRCMIEAALERFQMIETKDLISVYLAAIALGGQTLKLFS
jgi:hypothetical protein